MLRGDEIWCQLFSEPAGGSDVARLRSRAERDGDVWILNGQKVWTSGAGGSRFGLVIARTDLDVPKHRGITMFVLDMQSPRVDLPDPPDERWLAVQRGVLRRRADPGGNVVGEVNRGWQAALTTLMNERFSIGAGRIADDAPRAEDLIDVARSSGRSTDMVLRQSLADLRLRERVVGFVVQRVTALLLAGRQPGPEGSVVKLASTDLAKRSARLAASMAGPATTAWVTDDPGGGQWAEPVVHVPSLSIAGGTDEVLRDIVGERVLGLPKEPQVDTNVPFRDLTPGEPGERR